MVLRQAAFLSCPIARVRRFRAVAPDEDIARSQGLSERIRTTHSEAIYGMAYESNRSTSLAFHLKAWSTLRAFSFDVFESEILVDALDEGTMLQDIAVSLNLWLLVRDPGRVPSFWNRTDDFDAFLPRCMLEIAAKQSRCVDVHS